MEQIRSFIAIELPAGLKLELTQLQARLKTGNTPGIKWVKPDGMHLTLKFLGSVAAAKIDEITRAMTAAAREVAPFRLAVEQLGVFPSLKRVQVVWVGLGGGVAKLERLYRLLETNLARLGFAPESRPFKPHLTLARLGNKVLAEERQSLGRLIAGTGLEISVTIKVDAVSLIRSQLTREGAIYSRISSAELGQGRA
jgi:2'-5' RNA ligase